MAENVNILQLNELTNPSVPDVWFYCAIEDDLDPDRKMSYTNLVQFMALKNNTRAVGNYVVIAGNNTITWQMGGVNTPFISDEYSVQILDPNGIGVKLISQNAASITVNCFEGGVVHVIAILNT
jgi:hypothetical protein